MARKLGLGTTPPVDLTGATSGYLPVPGSDFEKRCRCLYTEGQAINLSIGQGLYQAANSPGGTSASVFAGFPIKVAGKTGTAEPDPVSSWYASWAPYNSPKLIVVANVEHGGFGAQAAAPIAKK